MTSSRRRRQLRWLAGGAFAALVVSGSLAMVSGGSAQAAVAPGTGSASAQAMQVTPHEGSLAIGATFGEALAGHTNTFARAQSQGLDLGAIGASLKGFNCGSPPNPTLANAVPEPLQTETGAPGSADGVSQGPSQADYGANEFVKANGTPYGEADTTFAGPLTAPGNLFSVSGLASKSWSGIIDGVREAGATADVGSLTIGGLVTLKGLHWEVLYPSSGAAKPSGSFSIGQAAIGSTKVPTQSLAQLQSVLDQALGQLGLEVQIPVPYQAQGVEFVPALQIAVVPSTTRNGITDPIINAVQPTYFQIANGLENGFAADDPPYNGLAALEASSTGQQIKAALCNSDTPITVADVTIASFTAAGFFNATFGGVNASSANLSSNQFNLTTGAFGQFHLPGSSQFVAGTPAIPGSPAIPGTSAELPSSAGSAPTISSGSNSPTSSGGTSPTSLPAANQKTTTAASTGYAAGGPMLAAGLIGLGLLALLAEGDRRMMRRAQHAVTFEE